MIHSFTFKNFCSFADYSKISFENIGEADKKNDGFFVSPAGKCLTKTMALIGPNASGKTNALKAISFLYWFAFQSFNKTESGETIPIFSFFPEAKNDKDISEFELIFEYNAVVYKYILHLCRVRVVKEELYRQNESTKHYNYLFKRNWDKKTAKSDVIQQDISLETEVIKNILRDNVSLFSTAVAIRNKYISELNYYFEQIVSNVRLTGKMEMFDSYLFNAAEDYNNKKELFNKASKFLKDIDLGLNDIELRKTKLTDKKSGKVEEKYLPYGVHKTKSGEHEIPFIFESNGTKNIFILLNSLLSAIETGGAAFIDEIEANLHPHIVAKIIELFANPSTNPKNSQLLFTTH
ncbi:MAG: ATP-binding protein, partial [Elusimicrobia bacterium]|nr:ATP-binding protein [Elusimicrobiota bacterium]